MILPTRNTFTIRLETIAKIFALINISLTGFCTLVTFAGFMYVSTSMIIAYNSRGGGVQEYDSRYLGDMLMVGQIVGTLVLLLLSLVALIFAVFLVHGLFKNKPEHIKAYFIYGAVVDVLSVCSVSTYFVLTDYEDFITFIILATTCIIYGVMLAVTRQVYLRKERTINQYSAKILVNSEKC